MQKVFNANVSSHQLLTKTKYELQMITTKDFKNKQGIEFTEWLFEGRLKQDKKVLPDGLNWLPYQAKKPSWEYNSLQIFSLLQIGMKMVFCYQNCSDLLWEKIVLVIEKNFWNSRLKAENFQNFWDHLNNLFKQWKVRTIFGNIMLILTCSCRFLTSY